MNELPPRWKEVRIRDVITPFETVDPTKTPNCSFTYVDIGSIDNQTQLIRDPKVMLGKDAPSRARRRIHAGDILFSTVRTYLKNIAVVPKELDSAVTSTGIAVLRPSKDIESRFLFNWTRSGEFLSRIGEAMDGTLYPAVTDRDVLDQTVPLPPVDEQRRIVAKLDRLFDRSKSAREELGRIPRLVERYKQAVLTAAFSGKLTQYWRDRNTSTAPDRNHVAKQRQDQFFAGVGRYEQPLSRPSECPPLAIPDRWLWFRIEAICDFITKGTTPPSSDMFSGAGEIPYIKVYNLTFTGELDFSKDPTFVSKNTHEGFLKRSKVMPRDVLMNIVGPPLGKVSVIPSTAPDWNINQAIAFFRPVASVEPKFLAFWLLSEKVLHWAVMRSKATAGQSNLTLQICRDMPMPLCSLDEQREIVRQVEQLFQNADTAVREAGRASALVDRLDQATLAKAFRGYLLPPNGSLR